MTRTQENMKLGRYILHRRLAKLYDDFQGYVEIVTVRLQQQKLTLDRKAPASVIKDNDIFIIEMNCMLTAVAGMLARPAIKAEAVRAADDK